MKKALVVLLALLVLAAAAAAVGAILYRRPAEPFKGYQASEQFVELAPGSSTKVIGEKLVQAGVVRDSLTFRLALWQSGVARQLKAGEYRFDAPISALDVVKKVAHGEVYLRPITFPEGLTIDDMAALFEAHGFGSASAFKSATSERELIADLDPQARNLEGYLFPETYALPRRASAKDLVRMMVRRFHQVFAPLKDSATAEGRSVREVVTLASIVEKETGKPEERPLVAAVYANRLRIGMGLQCDPTVIYGLRLAGRYSGNLTRDNLAWDSPYNTYTHPGLPPGPIAAPGRSALEAAAHPAPVDYLYFVSRNDGSHAFAKSLEEHNRNVYRYQKLYFREKRLQGHGH
jgi:UPF0755 protein